MDLTQIHYFLALSRTLNFPRAAEACNVTEPALTRSIQRLKEEIGGPLILRERALTQLTPLGRAMLPVLQAAHDAAEAVRVRAAEHRRDTNMIPLRLGLSPAIPGELLSAMLREVATRIEGLQLSLVRADEAALVDSLQAGDLDAALLPEAVSLPDRLNRWPLWFQQIVALVPDGHRLSAETVIPADTLRRAPLVSVTSSGLPATIAQRLSTHCGFELDGIHRTTCHTEAALLVAVGLGVCLAPSDLPVPPGVTARPLVEPAIAHPLVRPPLPASR